MAADPSQRTFYVTLNQSSDVASAVSADALAGSLLIGRENAQGHVHFNTYAVPLDRLYLCRATSGVAEVDSQFIPPTSMYFDAGNYLRYRGSWEPSDSWYYGECAAPTLVLRGKGVVITNNNAATIYWRKGTANTQGLTIAKPGDVNGNNVQGTPLYAYAQLILQRGVDYEDGEYLHLLGTAASQTATIQVL